MKKIKYALRAYLRRAGIYLGKRTKKRELQAFFQRLYPVTTNRKLVRIGEASDGGYLLPDDLEGIDACFSPGVAEDSHLETCLSEKGIKCYLADYSVDAPPTENLLFDFEKKFVGMENNSVYMTLEDWVSRKTSKEASDLILQMDIEGAEYEVILDTSNELLKRFRIMIIEFHNLDFLIDRLGFQTIDIVFRKLLKHFDVVHIHPNNYSKPEKDRGFEFPPLMEFTFLRKDRITERTFTTTFPHKHDSTNVPGKPDFPLPKCWYSQKL